jgi:hypothetical protein
VLDFGSKPLRLTAKLKFEFDCNIAASNRPYSPIIGHLRSWEENA